MILNIITLHTQLESIYSLIFVYSQAFSTLAETEGIIPGAETTHAKTNQNLSFPYAADIIDEVTDGKLIAIDYVPRVVRGYRNGCLDIFDQTFHPAVLIEI